MTEPSSKPSEASLDTPLDPVREQALEWAVRLRSGMATAADRQAYERWRAEDAGHAVAAQEADRLWAALGPAARPRTRRAVLSLAAAALAGGAALGGLVGWEQTATLFADLATGQGERRSVVLPDGSRLDLDAATSLDVAFGTTERRLVLHRGRFYVEVVPDPARPFRVAAASGSVQALGTAFVVARTGDAVEVVVTEHAVQVAYPDGGRSVRVEAGHSVEYSPMHGLEAPQAANPMLATAWRRGRLVFDGKPLGEVVAEIGRYRRGWVVFADTGLRRQLVTGAFPLDDTDALLRALPKMMPVRVRQLPLLTVIEADPGRRSPSQ